MSARKIFTSLAIATTVLVGTSGCSLTHNIPTLQEYAPSDGVQVTAGDLKLRNAFVLTDGSFSALYGSVVNSGLTDIDGSIQYQVGDAETKNTVALSVFAGEKYDIGFNGNPAITITGNVVAGATIKLWLTDGSGVGEQVDVPVLDGSNPIYADIFAASK